MTKLIAAALVKAQREFQPALKQSVNPHYKSKYADLANCIEAVVDALNNNGIALIQHTHECDDGVIVETIFLHESGEALATGKLHIPASKRDAPAFGSALSYARRYSLMTSCGIAGVDDDGQIASKIVSKAPITAPIQLENLSDAKVVIEKLNACKSLAELATVWANLTQEDREWHIELKDELKAKLSNE